MPFAYYQLLAAWGILLLILTVIYVVAYCTLSKRNHPFLMVKIAHLQRVIIVLFQVSHHG